MSRLFAATNYHLRLLVSRQSALAPILIYLGLLGAIYSSDAGPPVEATAVSAAALFPITAWLSHLIATAEAAPYSEITLVSVGTRSRHRLAQASAALVIGCALSLVTVLWGLLADSGAYHAVDIPIVLGMSIAECIAGAGLGAWLGPRARGGSAVAVVTAVGIASLLIRWLPPLNPLIRGLGEPPLPGVFHMFLFITQAAALGTILLCLAASRR